MSDDVVHAGSCQKNSLLLEFLFRMLPNNLKVTLPSEIATTFCEKFASTKDKFCQISFAQYCIPRIETLE